MESLAITTTSEVSLERVKWLLCAAFEGGSNYWYHDLHVSRMPDGKRRGDFEHWHLEVPFLQGGELGFKDKEDPYEEAVEEGLYRLDRHKIMRGLEVMANKYPKDWQDFIDENYDAWTGDTFLQCCVFGVALYG